MPRHGGGAPATTLCFRRLQKGYVPAAGEEKGTDKTGSHYYVVQMELPGVYSPSERALASSIIFC
jgi:hypothetical protein